MKIEKINTRYLVQSIADHVPAARITYHSDVAFYLYGYKLTISGNLVTSERVTFRYHTVKDLLLNLWEEGLLPCSGETLKHIQNRYANLEGREATDQFKKRSNEPIKV